MRDCPFDKCDGSGWRWMPDIPNDHREQCECYEEPVQCGEDVGFNFKCRRERGHAGPCTWDPKRLCGEEPV